MKVAALSLLLVLLLGCAGPMSLVSTTQDRLFTTPTAVEGWPPCTGDWLSATFSGPGKVVLDFPAPVPEGSMGLISESPPDPTVYMIYLQWNRLEFHAPNGGTYRIRITFGQDPFLCDDIDVTVWPE